MSSKFHFLVSKKNCLKREPCFTCQGLGDGGTGGPVGGGFWLQAWERRGEEKAHAEKTLERSRRT